MSHFLLEPSNNPLKHFLYIDNNVFRILKRDPLFYNHFFQYFEKHFPYILEDFDIIFTWQQLLEAIDLGKIINKIKTSPSWKLPQFNANNIDSINDSLERYFKHTKEVASRLSQLQPNVLIKSIDKQITDFSHPDATSIIEPTLGKAKKFIKEDSYMEDLTNELAWSMITSHQFIPDNNYQHYKQRKQYFDNLLALWYKMFTKGTELDFYRLIDNRTHTNLTHETNFSLGDNVKIKEGSDLGDSQLIHFVSLGMKDTYSNNRYRIIAITADDDQSERQKENPIMKRLAISKKRLEELQRQVTGWNINPIPGEIFQIKLKNKKIMHCHKIPCNIPWKGTNNKAYLSLLVALILLLLLLKLLSLI